MTELIEAIQKWMEQYPVLAEMIKIAGILLLTIISYFITKKIIIVAVRKFVKSTKNEYDDILLNDKLLKRISYIPPIIILNQFTVFQSEFDSVLDNILEAVIILIFVLSINTLLDALVEISMRIEKYKNRPAKTYAQVLKIIISIVAGIIIISLLLDKDPWGLLAGMGAFSAIVLLIFKDTILSFIASIQISNYDLIKVGDWIEVPSLGVDGDVMDMALHTIKVRNFDKTITTVPTNKLIEISFKNWRGMQETGGRRIKRSINIDLSSIKFCDTEMLNKFKKFQLIFDYIEDKKKELEKYNDEEGFDTSQLINGRRLTNVGTFREYLKAYLKHRKDINNGLTFLIRQLNPGPEGLPIEIYVFANTTNWAKYEDIQSDIFDHILSVVPEFDLKVFQNPSGSDFKRLSK